MTINFIAGIKIFIRTRALKKFKLVSVTSTSNEVALRGIFLSLKLRNMTNRSRRVVVTGVGIVSPLGCGSETVWSSLLASYCGISQLTQMELKNISSVKVAGFVPRIDGVDAFNHANVAKNIISKDISIFSQYALHASDLALSHSCIDSHASNFDLDRSGVAVASGIGSIDDIVEGSLTVQTSVKKLR